MKQTVIILCNSSNETCWAINYYLSHNEEKVIILTPDLYSQLILKQNNISCTQLYEVENFDINKNNFPQENPDSNIYKRSFETIKIIEQQSKSLSLSIFGYNLITLLANNLSSVYQDIFHSYDTYRKIVNKWKPRKIYVSANIHKRYVLEKKGKMFTLAFYIKYYFANQTPQVISFKTREDKIVKKIDFKGWIKIPWLIIQKYYYTIKNLTTRIDDDENKQDVLMETGGIISSYYYKLYKILQKKYNLKLVTYKLQLHQQIPLLKKGVRFILFDSFWKPKFIKTLKKHKINLLKKINEISINSESIKENNLRKAVTDQTSLFIIANLELTIKMVLIQKEILIRYKPKLVINSHDPSLHGASLVLQAKSRKISTLLILHGIYNEAYLLSPHSDYFAVWGPQTKRYFSKCLVRNPETIFPVGFPKFDEYNSNKVLKSKLNSNNVLTIGLILMSYFPNDSYQSKFFIELFESLNQLKVKVIINYRLHEGYNIQGIKSASKEYGIITNDQSDIELNKFIKNNQLIICWDTSALLWVMLHGKPLIHSSPVWKSGTVTPTSEYNCCWCPQNPNELVKIIKRFIDYPECYKELLIGQANFINDVAGPWNRKSSERLLKIIDKLIEKHEPKK